MKVIKQEAPLKSFLAKIRNKKPRPRVGFVPTMGALHAGHVSLIKNACKECDVVLVSIFVNPLQFGPMDDLTQYPRTLKKDIEQCARWGVQAVFVPKNTFIAKHKLPKIKLPSHSKALCGSFRPGHFQGVAQIIWLLFKLIRPDTAYFGQKDYQQYLLVKDLAKRYFNSKISIRLCPIARSKDGLALSSRNQYLTSKERELALMLSRCLKKGRQWIQQDPDHVQMVLKKMRFILDQNNGIKTDYLTCVDSNNLKNMFHYSSSRMSSLLLAGAVRIGKTRLIDNILIPKP